jgi:hypothetical protein
LKSNVETIYILENPEKNIIEFATGNQLRYEDIIKDVFGVACINDVQMMLQFNRNFQESICKRDQIKENIITIDRVIRVATKEELHQLREKLIEQISENIEHPQNNEISIPCPFDQIIKLQEGFFKWDESKSSYIPAKLGA